MTIPNGSLAIVDSKGSHMTPTVKWAGGKRALVDTLVALLPEKFGRYYEPFFGGGALFCALQPEAATIGDTNPGLMALYKKVRDEPDDLCRQLYELEKTYNNADFAVQVNMYYRLRTMYNFYKKDLPAVFVFLNKTCFNGLYRENRRGDYNTPFGKHSSVRLYDDMNIQYWHTALQNTTIITPDFLCGDFEDTVSEASCGDFVYLDPPYWGTYCRYRGGRFTYADNMRLARLMARLSEKGVYCMLSNADCSFIRKRYAAYNIHEVEVNRGMSRKKEKELIITNY